VEINRQTFELSFEQL